MGIMQQHDVLAYKLHIKQMDAPVEKRFLFGPKPPDQIIAINLRMEDPSGELRLLDKICRTYRCLRIE